MYSFKPRALQIHFRKVDFSVATNMIVSHFTVEENGFRTVALFMPDKKCNLAFCVEQKGGSCYLCLERELMVDKN